MENTIEREMFCVIINNIPCFNSFEPNEELCIKSFMDGSIETWEDYSKRQNAKCKKVNVTIEITLNP